PPSPAGSAPVSSAAAVLCCPGRSPRSLIRGRRRNERWMERVRVALVGLGSIAVGQYLPQIAELPDAEVVAVCDVRPDWAAEQARRFGIARVFTDFDAMLADAPFDALVNTASIPAHF